MVTYRRPAARPSVSRVPELAARRRDLLRAGGALGTVGLIGAAVPGTAHGDAPDEDPTVRRPILVGANPVIQLFDETGGCTAYLSIWVVDWSVHGSGNAIVLWRPDAVRVVGEDRRLALWLADYFVRHFPELDGLPWMPPVFTRSRVRVLLDLASGLRAHGGDVTVRMSEVLDLRTFATDEFSLAGVPHSLSLVLGPCARASVRVAGHALPGAISTGGPPERPSSSAFLAAAEVWRR